MEKKLLSLDALLRIRKTSVKNFLDGISGSSIDEKLKIIEAKFVVSPELKEKLLKSVEVKVEVSPEPTAEEAVEVAAKPKKKKKDAEVEVEASPEIETPEATD